MLSNLTMSTTGDERKLLPVLAGCLVLALAAGVAVSLRLARQPADRGETVPFVEPEMAALRPAGLGTEQVHSVSSHLVMPRLEYDLPLGRPAFSPTNVVLQLRWERMAPPSIWKDGIEEAERINELLLRRQREEWRRTHGL